MTYFSAAVFQQDVDVLLVLKMVIKVHYVFMVQYSVQLNFSVNLAGGGERQKVTTVTGGNFLMTVVQLYQCGVALLPSPVGEVWRLAHVG